jgi:hypothetical protein
MDVGETGGRHGDQLHSRGGSLVTSLAGLSATAPSHNILCQPRPQVPAGLQMAHGTYARVSHAIDSIKKTDAAKKRLPKCTSCYWKCPSVPQGLGISTEMTNSGEEKDGIL